MSFGSLIRGAKRLVGIAPKRRRFASIAYDKKRPDEVDGFKKIAEDDENVAYRDDAGRVRVGIRGTASGGDLLTDAKILGGKRLEDTSRFKRSENFVNKIRDQYKPADLSLSGHSLGGGIVNALSKKYGYTGSAYNPFLLKKEDISDKIKNVRSVFDPVSVAVAKDIKTDYSKLDFNPLKAHGISQFD